MRRTAIAAAPRAWFCISVPSECRGCIDLHQVDRERQAIDFLRAEEPSSDRGVGLESELPADDVPLRIDATQVEVGIGERVDHRVALGIAIADEALPAEAPCKIRIADLEFHLRTGGA